MLYMYLKTLHFFSFLSAMLVGPQKNIHQPETVVLPAVRVNDRKLNSEAIVLGFLAENDLPFMITPKLITLTKQ